MINKRNLLNFYKELQEDFANTLFEFLKRLHKRDFKLDCQF